MRCEWKAPHPRGLSIRNRYWSNKHLTIEDQRLLSAQGSAWRVDKADDPVFAPAVIVEFGTYRVCMSPSGRRHDLTLRNALADQSLLDPIRSLRGEPEMSKPGSPFDEA